MKNVIKKYREILPCEMMIFWVNYPLNTCALYYVDSSVNMLSLLPWN